MLLTEEEAMTRYCCRSLPRVPCLGSGCMAWRVVPVAPRHLVFQPGEKPSDDNKGGELEKIGLWRGGPDELWEQRLPSKGYCGLAGKPECGS